MLTNANQRAMRDLIHRYKHGLEAAIRMTTQLWDVKVVFEGSRAFTKGRTIVLPNVDIFALSPEITNEAVEEARAYFTALVGYAWREVGSIVESDAALSAKFESANGALANVIRGVLDAIRTEHRFSMRGTGIAEAIEYTREKWVWPRVIAKKQAEECPDLVNEMLHGLQCVVKHEAYEDHPLWSALEPEVQTFIWRNLAELEAAHDTLKMDAAASAARLGEITLAMLGRWKEEWKAIEATALRTISETQEPDDENVAPQEATAGLDEIKGADQLKTVAGLPPFLLVTYTNKPMSLGAAKFNGGYVRRVDAVPTTREGWEALIPVDHAETRTLVVLPPDPAQERALDQAMAEFVRTMMEMASEMEAEVQAAVEDAQHKLKNLPNDQQPYLVYTTADDQFVTTPEGSLSEYAELQARVMAHVGIVKRRLQVLLRTRTRAKWRSNQPEGDAIDQSAMAAIAVAPQVPQMELRPFRIKVERDALLDTLVGLLVDVSGSMSGMKLELARSAALCFAEALSLAKMTFGLWAFTSACHTAGSAMHRLINQCKERGMDDAATKACVNLYGRFGALHIETVKTFDAPWAAAQRRLPEMGDTMRANYDADSVEWTVQQMLSRKAKRRVLFVLSDGLPDTGEAPIQVARQRRHLSEVVRNAISANVEVVGIGICDNSVKLYYPHAVVIHRANDLPVVVMSEMDHLLLRSRR